MISQKANEMRKIVGVIDRLKKERVTLDKMAEKYPVEKSANLEAYAGRLAVAVSGAPSPFVNYKRANQGAKS